jgi:alkanesulfonate monooxygenase SsuD/methylene tetrahydromethanopterin reductase-like flavin-dependent oxidoreductase (luciferase family)
MKLGLFIQPVHPSTRDYGEVLREDQEAVILADKLGMAEAYIGEHMTDLMEPITSCLLFIGTLINRTFQIKLASGVVNLTSYHPVHVAAHVAMIDHLLEGRFLFGIGPGALPTDLEVFGNLDIDKNEKMVEAIDHILSIWAGEAPYNLKGRYFATTTERTMIKEIGQGSIPKPLQKPHPPIVFTAIAPHSQGVSAAAERGWTGISSNYVQAHWVATHLHKFLEGRRNAGLTEDPSLWRVAKSIFVADDESTACRYAKSESGPFGSYFKNIMSKIENSKKYMKSYGPVIFKSHPNQPDSEVNLQHTLDTQVIAGTPEQVAEEIVKLREIIGSFGTLIYTAHDWVDPSLSRRSMELMAKEVMPRVNTALGE